MTPDTYRGWRIWQGRWPEPAWSATSPDYDCDCDQDGFFVCCGDHVQASTRNELITEIDAWIEENA